MPECKTSPPPPTPPPAKEAVAVNTVCSINDLGACGRNQACVQVEGSADQQQGLCECLAGFAKQDDGVS